MRSVKEILAAGNSLDEKKRDFIAHTYEYALRLHEGQKRRYSTEPIDVHVTRVALILAELGMAHETISAGLLHHALREGNMTKEEISREFGETVGILVEGATKLRDIKFTEEVHHVESLRKLFVASATDIRILILKLADRLDSMRNLFKNKGHHYRISKETMEIYVPLAHRLGLRAITREMEDLAFRYLDPEKYTFLEKALAQKRRESNRQLEKFRKALLKQVIKSGVRKAKTDTRLKGIYSIHGKITRRQKDLEKIYDIFAVRVHVETVADCYQVLGIVHSMWRPLPGRIKDYIAFPKPNGYQSLHTTVFTGDGLIVEVQIRTYKMHEQAEYGFASHIAYKERERGIKDPHYSWFEQFFPRPKDFEEEPEHSIIPEWLRRLVDVQTYVKGPAAPDQIQADFFQHRMFIFDRRGDVIDLPINSTPLDFAYELNTHIGNRFQGARVNGKMVSIDTPLKNGDVVEIFTKNSSHPTRKWLSYAKTVLAHQEIARYLESRQKFKK